MCMWSFQKSFFSRNKTIQVEIRKSPDGRLFRYYVLKWFDVCDEDEGAFGDGFWSISDLSGYYETLEECEAGARNDVPGLGDGE